VRLGRRRFLEAAAAAGAALPCARAIAAQRPAAALGGGALELDASMPAAAVRRGHLRMGSGRSPSRGELGVDSRSLLLEGRPLLPVTGEFHYARYPEGEWRTELLKMKAGGVQVAASYVFWIHHEEVDGVFDWTGSRSLRRFLELCREVDLLAVVRCGPWCHGEVRNGGLPDWILQQGYPVRGQDPRYLARVRRLFGEIAAQVAGQLWRDGGPVIGIQLENEYGGPAEHLLTLKSMAREVGLDVPLYTRTGWPQTRTPLPPGELVPLFGSYVDGFWDRELVPRPEKYGDAFLFKRSRIEASIAMGPQEDDADAETYPLFCCEIGGGMERSYHRRIRVAPADIEAAALVKLGCGNNLQGYYMYHGGANPEGRRTTLQESQATKSWNDVHVKSYDFQAPLGEFGQVREHYHRLRRLHLLLDGYGSLLATLPLHLPRRLPAGPLDRETLRWSARSDGRQGFVFVNNYHRGQEMPAKAGVQFQVRLQAGPLVFPAQPFTVPADASFVWPFGLDLPGARLLYATAQPLGALPSAEAMVLVFARTAGIPAEFTFERRGVEVEAASGRVTRSGPHLHVAGIEPGTGAAIRLRTAGGKALAIVLLDEEMSLACWKGTLAGRERLFLTRAGLVLDGARLRLSASDPSDLTVAMLPAPGAVSLGGVPVAGVGDGLFTRFQPPAPRPARATVAAEVVRPAGPPRRIPMGSEGVAEAPTDADFAQAAVWRLRLSADPGTAPDLLLRVHYVGDAARLYLGERLLADNFFNGTPFECGVQRCGPDVYREDLLLKVLPLSRGAPIYLPASAWSELGAADSSAAVRAVELVERHHLELTAS
jgi:beta-galactosidase